MQVRGKKIRGIKASSNPGEMKSGKLRRLWHPERAERGEVQARSVREFDSKTDFSLLLRKGKRRYFKLPSCRIGPSTRKEGDSSKAGRNAGEGYV